MIYLIIAFLCFLITIVSTPYLIEYLIKKDIVDIPGGEERRIHTEPIPRMGGIIIFAVIIVITFSFYQDIYSKKFFIAGALVLFALGAADDYKSVKWYVKFLVQSISAILLMLSINAHNFTVISFIEFTLYPGLNYIILFILILGILNSFNLLDGLDGLVTGISLVIAAMCFLLSLAEPFSFLPVLAAATIGTTLGFLKFNANPARIFLGDSGSLILGYIVTGLVIAISSESSNGLINESGVLTNRIDLTFIIIVFAVPIGDTLRVMYTRITNKRNPFLPDSSHIHHILYSQKIRHKTVVLLIQVFSVMFVLLAIYYTKVSKINALIIFALMFTAFLSVRHIVEFIIKKDHLLAYGQMYKKIPQFIPSFYKKYLLPIVTLILTAVLIILTFTEVKGSIQIYKYFILLIFSSLLYSGITLRKKGYYAELLVLINLIVFFIITGLNGFFYKPYPFPIITQININQILVIVLSGMIIFFVLFKERIHNLRQQFLSGTDLTIALFIAFVYVAMQFINLPDSYKISDTLLRSFLVFLFYKIIITIYPRTHFALYYISFLIAVIAILKSLF
ncbi:MAG: undecaprenyl/decaprenyl-phosphate alpha-N-acetylglucosaminyl 1-phosphate transferase [Ignavibacterium sp.]|nr:undecaprenyl/decaprenyl-phosphate alpha-N-acetylglucosaminyl 1-phosphate transferase [Ignavibacterium sp.]